MSESSTSEAFMMDVEEVVAGLQCTPRRISSKYLYDARGEAIFRQIMDLPEYYLTRAENEILALHAPQILHDSCLRDFDIVELGAGDGSKTLHLLKASQNREGSVRYIPIDIAQSAIDAVTLNVLAEVPDVPIQPILGDYQEGLRTLHVAGHRPELVLFLGSNIGNYSDADAVALLTTLCSSLDSNDRFLLGVDLRKHPQVIYDAYNDASGLTSAFNLNVITRMQRELGATCSTEDFDHYESYDPLTGEARSYLVAEKDLEIRFSANPVVIHLSEGESILTEISRKYTVDHITSLARQAGFHVEQVYTDGKGLFADVLLSPR